MPVTPPIDRRALVKKGYLKEEDFYQMLSEQNNYVDKKVMKDFYMGMVRVITQELRRKGIVRLPHLGDFALVKQKDRLGWRGKARQMIIGQCVLKFYANGTWRIYLNKLSRHPSQGGKIDPREKLLGMELE